MSHLGIKDQLRVYRNIELLYGVPVLGIGNRRV